MKSRGTAAAAAVFRDTDTLDRIEDTLGGKKMRTMDVIRRIIDQHLWPHKKVLAVSFAAMLVVAATTAGIPFLIQLAADELAIAGNEQMIVLIPLLTIAIMTTKAVAEYISAVGQGFVGERLVADLRHDLFDALARADIAWLQNTHSGRFVASFMTDINAIRDASGVGLVALAGNLLKVIFLFGAMVYMDWLLSLFALAILPIAVRLMGRQRKKMFRSTSQMFQETGDLSSLISQALSGMRVVRAYGQEQAESARVQAVAERTYRFMMQSIRVKAATGPIVEALTGIGFAAAIFYSGYRGMAGTLTPGEFIGFMTAAMLMYQPLRAFATLQTVLQTGVAAASRVYGVIDTERQVTDRADAVELDVPTGEIVFDKVSFAYREGRSCPERFRPHRRAGQPGRAGRAVRRRQEHGDEPPAQVLRSGFGPYPDRRPEHRPRPHRQRPPPYRARHPGTLPVRRHRARQYRLWHRGRERRRYRGRRQGRGGA